MRHVEKSSYRAPTWSWAPVDFAGSRTSHTMISFDAACYDEAQSYTTNLRYLSGHVLLKAQMPLVVSKMGI